MMSKFIELHTKKDSLPVSVNVENIVAFEDGDIGLREIGILKIAESYDELKQLILDAGVLIHKADPRLDQSHPLTKEDIKEMEVNEPIWNSNDREWYQIANWSDLNDFMMTLQNIYRIIRVDEKDLIATPFYRMRQ